MKYVTIFISALFFSLNVFAQAGAGEFMAGCQKEFQKFCKSVKEDDLNGMWQCLAHHTRKVSPKCRAAHVTYQKENGLEVKSTDTTGETPPKDLSGPKEIEKEDKDAKPTGKMKGKTPGGEM